MTPAAPRAATRAPATTGRRTIPRTAPPAAYGTASRRRPDPGAPADASPRRTDEDHRTAEETYP
ncbi:hypothetical protein [Streptomyces sp. NPDC060031]|uniref:hypothetical protein n=1 Tax=Streptomyces sp. NPDC060031 TaxID=3347043 RepID=UPI003688CF03